MRTAVFLDRDGTLIRDVGYLSTPSGLCLERHAASGLRKMASFGHLLIVVSNQSGVSRGLFTAEDVMAVNRHLADLLAGLGVVISGWYFCPHQEGEGCRCRLLGLVRR